MKNLMPSSASQEMQKGSLKEEFLRPAICRALAVSKPPPISDKQQFPCNWLKVQRGNIQGRLAHAIELIWCWFSFLLSLCNMQLPGGVYVEAYNRVPDTGNLIDSRPQSSCPNTNSRPNTLRACELCKECPECSPQSDLPCPESCFKIRQISGQM